MISHRILNAAIVAILCTQFAMAEHFSNPILKNASGQCESQNIAPERFAPSIDETRRIDICVGIDGVAKRLNSYVWTDELRIELDLIWKSFAEHDVFFSPMPEDSNPAALAITQSFPSGRSREKYSSTIYLKLGVEKTNYFYHVVFHELRHVYDFHQIWKDGRDISPAEIERLAFRIMSLLDEETPPENRFSKTPTLWHDSWRDLDTTTRELNRQNAISSLIRQSTHYSALH